jgi:UDP-N-acetylmuramoylalanine--D-glutamate ligase
MKYAVFGLGVSGLSALKLLSKLGYKPLVVNSGDPESWENREEILKYTDPENCFSQLDAVARLGQVDCIILSPGISLKSPILVRAHENRVPIIGEVELAFRNIDLPIIGITGTNGKTTTSMMVAKALEIAGYHVFLGGNIGTPVSELALSDKKYDYAVLELSSFQLETIDHFRSHISIITNITPNHMERYESFEDYFNAKLRLLENNRSQDLILVDSRISSSIIAKHEVIQTLPSYDLSRTLLKGDHNKKNFYCAYKVLDFLEVHEKDKVMQELIDTFHPVEHRLEFTGRFNDLDYFNDSKSTNFRSTQVALDAFSEGKSILIMGGQLRHQEELGAKLYFKSYDQEIDHILAFGESADKLESELSEFYKVVPFKNLEDVFDYLKGQKFEAKRVIFSPGFPSFDQYKKFSERGNHFKELFHQKLEN